ncbi:hypothetical protein [Sphingomonas sp. PB1R3]|uniref:hypothetical protein n=1 Tax=Sphingomonas flavida TaxID=3096154 RepID=UPI002FC8621E
MLGIILRSAGRVLAVNAREQEHAGDIAGATAAFAERLARASDNEEHLRAMHDINARLHAVRLVEADLLADTGDELARLSAAADRGDVAALRTGWRRYHRRRQRLAPEIVRALLRD